ncbi:MATE family efflux transporter [Paenibacillus sp. 481]|uniref:MATE family efflux transporter n=1 Tax=Paenibacillus sp. 481 TaxID=2835869 RepID=UPI001E6513E4|nr:MATE family efflux transporter [Paenibacillus sp. 481]UHA73590.1 MATE family efflux transporter [Paenibacillus sp. 481]
MKQTSTMKQKAFQLMHILIPILVTQVAMQLMTFFDTVMSGNYSKEDLAGVAIASSIWVPIYTGLAGIFVGVTPIVAQHLGAGRKHEIAPSVTQATYLSVLFGGAVIGIGAFALNPILAVMNLEPTVHRVAHDYLAALAIGIVPLFIYQVLRACIDGLGQTRITMFITLISFPVNVALNYLFIFGKLGMPELGGAGAGLATAITYIVITIVAIVFVRSNEQMRQLGMLRSWKKISFKRWGEVLRIGGPIGLSIFFEVSVFAAVTLFMSDYDTVTIAAHQAALNFASLLYMLPLSIAMSLTILVGYEVGAKRFEDARVYARFGVISAIAISALCAIFLFVFNTEVARLYTPDPTVRTMTETFLVFAIFFQLSDAVAAPVQGVLRGYKDVNAVFIIAFASYWIIGLPLGYALAKWTEWGAYGYWIGLISGLAIGAVALFIRLAIIERRVKLETAEGSPA